MTRWLVASASTYAPAVDNLILLIAVIVGLWFVAAEAIFFGLVFRFRARPGVRGQYVAGEDKREKRWVSYPHYAVLVFDVIIIVAALRVWTEAKLTTPAAASEPVRVIAQQWAWTFVHAGPDGKLDTTDDIRTVDDLHVQEGQVYTFELHSKDVVHSFSVPAFRLKQDAVPGRVIHGWFMPTLTGTFDIQCAQMCGMGHALMPGRVHIETAAEHAAWMANAAKSAVAMPPAPSTPPVARVETSADATLAGGDR